MVEETKGKLSVTNNPNIFLDEEGSLYYVEFVCLTGEHKLVKLSAPKELLPYPVL